MKPHETKSSENIVHKVNRILFTHPLKTSYRHVAIETSSYVTKRLIIHGLENLLVTADTVIIPFSDGMLIYFGIAGSNSSFA